MKFLSVEGIARSGIIVFCMELRLQFPHKKRRN
jgi:hypothetical protein